MITSSDRGKFNLGWNWRWYSALLILSLLLIPLMAGAISYGYSELVFAGIVGLVCLGVTIINPIAGIYLLTFFLPFERIGSVDLSGITIRISQVLVLTTVIGWIARGFVRQRFKLRSYPIFAPVGLFLAVNILALQNSPNLKRSFMVLGFLIFTMIISLAIPNIIRHRPQLEKVVNILLLSAVLVSLFGIFQFLGDLIGLPESITGLRPQYTKAVLGFPRVQSTALEPLYFANYLLLPLFVSLGLWLSHAGRLKNKTLLLVIALTSLNLILTVSRGGYIAAGVSAGLLGLLYWRSLARPRILLGSLIALIVIALVVTRFLNINQQWENFSEHVTNIFSGASYEERVETFKLARRIWWQHPVIGIGPGSFGPYASYHPLIMPSDGYKIVNNEYIELLAETGVLGLSSFVIIILVLLARSWRAWRLARAQPYLRALVAALTATFIGILIQYNTFSVLYITHVWFTIGLLIAVQNIVIYEGKNGTQ